MKQALRIVFLVFSLVLIIGCTLPGLQTNNSERESVVSVPSDTHVEQSSPTSTNIPESAPESVEPQITATVTEEVPALNDAYLLPQGPWIVAYQEDGIYIMNADGGAITQISNLSVFLPDYLETMVSPSTEYIAFVTSSDPNYYRNMVLHVLTIPNGETVIEIPLTSTDTEPPANIEPGSDFSKWIATGEFAWSPNSRYIAFTALIDGPTSDIYTLDVESGQVTRWTSGLSQAYNLHWSPDSRYVLHYGVDSFGTGAGYAMAGTWAVDMVSGDVLDLYKPQSGDEIVLGWWSDTDFMVLSWSAACAYNNLRTVNVATGTETVYFETCFTDAVMDTYNGNTLIVVGDYTSEFCPCGSPVTAGTYGLKKGSTNPYQVSIGNAYTAQILPVSGMFLVNLEDNGRMILNNDFSIYESPFAVQTLIPYSTPLWDAWAWNGTNFMGESGIWVGSGEPDSQPVKITDIVASQLVWNSTGENFLFTGGEGLYTVHRPDYSLQLVSSNWFLDLFLIPYRD